MFPFFKQFNGTGAVRDIPDVRDFKYTEALGAAPVEIDWEKGYSVYEALHMDKKTIDQNGSFSCVPQATMQYARVWHYRNNAVDISLSPRFIYHHIHLPEGGAFLRDSMKFFSSLGSTLESTVPSYENGNPPSEQFMRTLEVTDEMRAEAKPFDQFSYRMIDGAVDNIDVYAHAIKNNFGVLGGFTMTNEGWTKPVVEAPKKGEKQLGHAVYLCGFGMYEEKQCIFTPNSWGGRYTIQEGRWKGLQAIPVDYFEASEQSAAGEVKGIYVFPSWVLVPDESLPTNQRAMDFLRQREGKLVQDSEQSGSFGIIKNGRILVADKERVSELIANYLVVREGVPVPKDIWNECPKEQF